MWLLRKSVPFIRGVNGALYHFANNYKLKNHRCNVDQVQKDAITLAMVYANSLLATRDFSVSGQATAIISSTIGLGKPTYCSFEGNLFPGWAGPTAVRI